MIIRDLSNSFYPVPKPKNIKKSKETKIKNKSNKLARLENKRFSIITKELEKCYFCNNKKMDLHEVFRGRNRQKSMKWGLVVPLCRTCHNKITEDKDFSKVLEDIAKLKFIKKYSKEKFTEEFK